MDGAGCLVFVIVVFVFLGRILPKILGAAAKGGAGGAGRPGAAAGPRRADFMASPTDIMVFLKDLEGQRAPQRPAAAAVAAAAPPAEDQDVVHSVFEDRPPIGGDLAEAPLPVVAGEEPTVMVPAGAPPQRRRKQRRQPSEPPQRAMAATSRPAPVDKGAPQVTRGPQAAALGPGGLSLRQAVIWSEILGPPVSLRRRAGQRPSSPDKP